METALQIIIVIAIVAVAVWYLYRRFRRIVDPGQPACGCGCGKSCTSHSPVKCGEE